MGRPLGLSGLIVRCRFRTTTPLTRSPPSPILSTLQVCIRLPVVVSDRCWVPLSVVLGLLILPIRHIPHCLVCPLLVIWFVPLSRQNICLT